MRLNSQLTENVIVTATKADLSDTDHARDLENGTANSEGGQV